MQTMASGKSLTALGLSAILALLPLASCATQSQEPSKGNDETAQAAVVEEDAKASYIVVEPNVEGTYTITIENKNLIRDEQAAEDDPAIVSIVEAESAGIDVTGYGRETPSPVAQPTVNAGPTDDAGSDTEAETSQAEPTTEWSGTPSEGSQAAPATDGEGAEGQPETMVEPTSVEQPSVDFSLTKANKEDVTVLASDISKSQDDPAGEIRALEITEFVNEGDRIKLTFTDPQASDKGPGTYTVRFAKTDHYVVVVSGTAS